MSQGRRGRRRQPRVRESASQPERQRRPHELEKEIWTSYGSNIPGNPRYTTHAPEHAKFVDASGNEVSFMESRLADFHAGPAGIEKSVKVNQVLQVPALWAGPMHYLMTNALRLLQACSVADRSERYDDMRRMRAGITPLELLKQTGLDRGTAERIIDSLKKLDLLKSSSNGTGPCWYVHLTFRAIGPENQKFTKVELIDGWALPEPEADTTTPAEDEELPESPDEADPGFIPDETTPAATLAERLTQVYEACLTYVPENPEMDDGMAVFSTPGPLGDLIPEKTNLTKPQVRTGLSQLSRLEVTEFRMIGAGRWRRRIKLDAGPFGEQHIEQLRQINRQKIADRSVNDPTNRLTYVRDAYKALKQAVPEGAVPDADGWVEFETDYSLTVYLAREIPRLTERQAERLLADFRALGVLENTSKGSSIVRRLRVNKHFTAGDYERIRAARRKDVTVPTKVAKPAVASSAAAVVQADTEADEIEQIFEALTARLDSYSSEIVELKSELKKRDQTIARLEGELAAQKAKPAITIPPALRKHLDG